jgi:hypothetical protein
MSALTATTTMSAEDRCDGCGAQAYVRVRLVTGGELLFCGHHWGRHSDALKAQAVEVVDETDRLTEVASSPED